MCGNLLPSGKKRERIEGRERREKKKKAELCEKMRGRWGGGGERRQEEVDECHVIKSAGNLSVC